MNLLLFFLVNFVSFSSLVILFGYGFEQEAKKLTKYFVAFFAGMVVMELIR